MFGPDHPYGRHETLLTGEDDGQLSTWALERAIGRRPDKDIVVSDLGVSKQHAELRRPPDGRVTIVDLGSHNGTFVNGARVRQADLTEATSSPSAKATFRFSNSQLCPVTTLFTPLWGTCPCRVVDGLSVSAAVPWSLPGTSEASAEDRGSERNDMADKRPNIVVFFWDKLGCGEVGCYGGGTGPGAA